MKIIFLLLSVFSICTNAISQNADNKNWQSLFNGKDLSGWKQVTGSAIYQVNNGIIEGITVPNSPNSFLRTEKEYGDFIVEFDVKVEDTTSNSGMQTRSHFDPAGNNGKGKVYGRQIEVDPSSRKWTGGVYDEGRREWLYPLELNPNAKELFKLNEFNTIRVECIGAITKTFVNGVATAYVIDTLDNSGFIALQVHAISSPDHAGKKVYFKNIRIQTTHLQPKPFAKNIFIVNNLSNNLSEYEKNDGWKLLFDGSSSKGWVSAKDTNAFPAKGWEIQDGYIKVLPSGGKESTNGGDIVTTQSYSAFDLRFCFKLTPGANSGVKYFVTLKEPSSNSAIGLEYQVLDDTLHPDAKLGRDGNRTLASLYDLIKANKTKRFIHPIGEWNEGRVVVYPDNHVEHYLNGIKVLSYQRGSAEYRALVAISKYKVYDHFGEAAAGRILLQDHGDAVSFKNIKIKVLK